jgi:hypothetical protein
MINDHIIGLAPGFLHEAGITHVLISLNCTGDGFYTNMKILYIIQKWEDGEPTAGVRFFGGSNSRALVFGLLKWGRDHAERLTSPMWKWLSLIHTYPNHDTFWWKLNWSMFLQILQPAMAILVGHQQKASSRLGGDTKPHLPISVPPSPSCPRCPNHLSASLRWEGYYRCTVLILTQDASINQMAQKKSRTESLGSTAPNPQSWPAKGGVHTVQVRLSGVPCSHATVPCSKGHRSQLRLPSGQRGHVMKNWLPLVFGPVFTMDKQPAAKQIRDGDSGRSRPW